MLLFSCYSKLARIATQFIQSCVTLFFAFFHLITLDNFKKDIELNSKVEENSTPSENFKVDVFPFLRLPLLAREHIVCMMTPFELIDLSMTSSRARQAVTFFSKVKPRFRVTLENLDETLITISGHEEEWQHLWASDQLLTEPSLFYIEEFSEDPIRDCMKWYETIKGVLGCRIDKVRDWCPNKSITDWLRAQQDSIEDVSMMQGHQNDVKYFLKTMKVFGELEIEIADYGSDFLMEIPEGPIRLDIYNSRFIKYEQFLRLKHQEIVLEESEMTSKEINLFLMSWMACESHLDLKYLMIYMYELKIEDVLMNIPYERTTDPDIMVQFTSSPFWSEVPSGFNIRRRDGKMATVPEFWDGRDHFFLLIH